MTASTVRAAAFACLIASFSAFPDTASQASHQAGAWACDQNPIVITRASVWTPEGIQTKRELVVEKGSIRRIGSRVDRPASARVIDAEGAIVLPGLIDSHAHLDVWPGPMPRDAMQVLSTLGRQTLSSGVTTVRMHLSGLDDGPPFKRQAADDCSPAPRVVLGGLGLEGGAPDLAVRLMRGVSGSEDARRKVRDVAASGADWLAIHDADRFSKLELEAIAAEAQVRAIKLMAADGYRRNPAAVVNPIHTRFIDPKLADGLLSALQRQLREGDGGAIEASFQTLGPKFRQLRAAGLTLLLGTDSGSPGQFHSDAIWHEMRAWRDLGVPVDKIIEAGTVLPSRMLERSDIGQIREGARADLLIYGGNLRETLDVGRIRDVIKGGVVFVRDGRWIGP